MGSKKLGMTALSVIVLALLTVAFAALGAGGRRERTRDIAVLYTGDVHCAVEDNIGYAGLAAYKRSLEAEGCEVLLVDTGDAIQGAAFGSFSTGADVIKLMNALGYDAMTLGNHEFDYAGPARVAELAAIADFPFLSVNLRRVEGGEQLYSPYTIIDKGGVRIAFVGVSTPKTLTSSTPAYFMEGGSFVYDFMNDKTGETLHSAVQRAVDAARGEGADYVIALTHLGIGSVYSPYTSNELIAATTGINAVLDGHSHTVIECARVKNKDGERVLLSSTGARLENIGLLWIDRSGNISTGMVSDVTEKDAAITALIEDVKADYAAMLYTPVGTFESDMTVDDPATGVRIVRSAETNLGDFCADAYRAAGDADIGFANGGGVRKTLEAGEISYGDLLEVNPFGNLLCKARVSGQTILDALELSVSKLPEESGGFLQVSGISFEIDMTVDSSVTVDENGMFLSVDGARRVGNVKVGSEDIDAEKYYTVVSVSYILKNGGNGYTMFSPDELIMDEFMLDIDALTAYLNGPYLDNAAAYAEPYGDGRIVALAKP